MHDDGRWQADKGPGEEAIARHQHGDAGRGRRGEVAEAQHARHEGARKHHVERAQLVREEVWNDAPKDGRGVHDGQEVEAQIGIRDVLGDGVDLGVEERHVQAHETDEEAEHEERVGWHLEGCEVEERARFGGEDSHAHDEVGYQHRGEDDEADDAGRPRETDPWKELVEDDGVNYATQRAPTCSYELSGFMLISWGRRRRRESRLTYAHRGRDFGGKVRA